MDGNYRKHGIYFITALSLLLILMSPMLALGNVTLAAPPEDYVVWETIGNPDYLDPHVNYESFGSWVMHNVYETLYTYEWDSDNAEPTVPLLAETLEISTDGRNYTFTLRQGITFHDGTPFNASCVKYNIERVLGVFDGLGPAWMIAEPILGGQIIEDAVYSYGEGSTEHVVAYTAWKAGNDAGTGALIVLDDYVIRIRLVNAYAPFLAALTHTVGSMMSPTYVETHGGIVIGEHNSWMDAHMCGTGPYMLEGWAPNDRILLDRNDNYWRKTAAQTMNPNYGSIGTVSIKTNEEVNSRILNIQSGETDGCYWPTTHAYEVYNGVTEDSGDGTIKSNNPNLKVWCGEPTFDVTFLGFNMNPTYSISGVQVESAFTIIETREAFSYAFDYQTFIDSGVNGFGIQQQGPIPQGMFGHDDSLFMYSYDLTKAQTAWNAAMASGLDAIWANASYEFTMYYNSGNTVRASAYLIIKNGITDLLAMPGTTQPSETLEITVQSLEWSNYLSMVRNRQLPIYFLEWTADYADSDNYIGPFVKSTGTYPNRIGLGISDGWNAAEVDGWIDDAVQTLNGATREGIYFDIQEAIVDQVAYIWCYQSTNFHVEHERMNGYTFNPMHDVYFYHRWKGEGVTTTETTTTNTTDDPFVFDLTIISYSITIGSIVVIIIIVILIMKRRTSSYPTYG